MAFFLREPPIIDEINGCVRIRKPCFCSFHPFPLSPQHPPTPWEGESENPPLPPIAEKVEKALKDNAPVGRSR